jgi:flagellar protein FliS
MDMCISALMEAADAADKNDIERRCVANTKAQRVIIGLKSTLDMEQGGDVARQLNQLYEYVLRRLAAVDFKNDASAAREAADLLIPLRDAWETLHTKNQGDGSPHKASAPADGHDARSSSLTLTT